MALDAIDQALQIVGTDRSLLAGLLDRDEELLAEKLLAPAVAMPYTSTPSRAWGPAC